MHLGEQRLLTSIQHKAFVRLMGLQYLVQYKKGISNSAADALSIAGHDDLCAVSSCIPTRSWHLGILTAWRTRSC